jgi:ribosome biogenesis protein SSF1/2
MTNYSPIVVTNNFGDHTAASHIKLLRITFQNLFPQINVSTIKLKDCRRVVLFNLIEEEKEGPMEEEEEEEIMQGQRRRRKQQIIEMRHYAVKATPLGMNRKVRRILEIAKKTNRAPPNLHNVHDIADYITNQSTSLSIMPGSSGIGSTSSNSSIGNVSHPDIMSDSEPEDDVEHQVTLPDTYVGVGNVAQQKSALKLMEIGPRLSLQLIKVEKGLSDTNKIVLYNLHVTKSKEEIETKQNEINRAQQLKEERKRQQEQNVEQKRLLKEQKLQQKQRKLQQQSATSGIGMLVDPDPSRHPSTTTATTNDDDSDNDDDDAYKIEGVSSSSDDDDENNNDDDDEE